MLWQKVKNIFLEAFFQLELLPQQQNVLWNQLNNANTIAINMQFYLLRTQLEKTQLNFLLFVCLDLCVFVRWYWWCKHDYYYVCYDNVYVTKLQFKCAHNNFGSWRSSIQWHDQNFCTLFNNFFYEIFHSFLFHFLILFCFVQVKIK